MSLYRLHAIRRSRFAKFLTKRSLKTAPSGAPDTPSTATTLMDKLRGLTPHIAPLGPSPAGWERTIGLVGLFAIVGVYCVILLRYFFTLHDALSTNAEDMGIMDQVLWNSAHGHFWHQTICNPISDSNCLGDASRWAIHVEPLMIALVPLYWFVPGPHTLMCVQVIGVAVGALPAYWLGSRRLGSVWYGWLAAAGYLTMPILRAAVLDDFHMVTLAAPALMFALYYLYARNNRGLLIACILAMGTKEQVPVDVFMIGLALLAFQGRWRWGAGFMLLSTTWALVAQRIIHIASPLGISPTADRYDGVSGTLGQIPLLPHEPDKLHYLWQLLSNSGGLGILAPWVLLLAAPSALINALSDDFNQYSGLFQYNADIAPFLLLAGIEGFALLLPVLTWMATYLARLAYPLPHLRPSIAPLAELVLIALVLLNAQQVFLNASDNKTLNPIRPNNWPTVTAHDRLAQHFFTEIPAAAALSAQSNLVAHLSQRHAIYQFPDQWPTAAYIFLDMTGDYYPELSETAYLQAVQTMLQSGTFTVVDARDGYILLKQRATPSGPTVVPPSFCPINPVANTILLQGIDQIGNCSPPSGG